MDENLELNKIIATLLGINDDKIPTNKNMIKKIDKLSPYRILEAFKFNIIKSKTDLKET